MNQCLLLPSAFCGLYDYMPRWNGEEWASFLLGSLIVIFFAIDHYKIPTYAKTTIGDFIELAPESLTSSKRYRKGLYIYIFLVFCLYLTFCFFWSKGFTTILESTAGIKVVDKQLWPLAAATAVTLIGTASDKNPLGRLEGALRSMAHESAYIPDAVLTLSSTFNGSFEITDEVLRQLQEPNQKVVAKVKESQDGSLQTWIRARFLFSRFDLLRTDPDFVRLLATPENVRGLNFLTDEYQGLAERVAQNLAADRLELDDALKKKVDNFRSAVSVFLASLLWQGCDSEIAINRKITKLKLPIPSSSHFSWGFIRSVLASLAAVAVALYIVVHLINWQLDSYLKQELWHLTLAALIFVLCAVFVSRRRSMRLTEGKVGSTFDVALALFGVCALPIAFAAAIATFAFHQGTQARFWAMFLTALALAMLATMLFEIVMRWASQSPPTRAAARRLFHAAQPDSNELRRLIGKTILLYGGCGFVAVFILFWFGQQLVAKSAPPVYVAEALKLLDPVIDSYSSKPAEVHAKFQKALPIFAQMKRQIEDAQGKMFADRLDEASVDKIVAQCLALNKETDLDVTVPSTCEINGDVTRNLGKGGVGTWLENFREAMLAVGPAVTSLRQLAKYSKPMTAFRSDWPRALIVSSMWAVWAAVFGVSVLLYRRNNLWGTADAKFLSDYTSTVQVNAEKWLRTPIDELNNLTPLELMRYADLRASLSDYLVTNRPPEAASPVGA